MRPIGKKERNPMCKKVRSFVIVALATWSSLCLGCGSSNQAAIEEQLKAINEKLAAGPIDGGGMSQNEGLRTTEDAKGVIKKLGNAPNAQKLAEALATIDSWSVSPEEQKPFTEFKTALASQLRQKAKEEVVAIQKAALESKSGSEGAEKHADAGRILSLYPMSDDPKVIAEAKRLAAQQAEIAARLEVLRRQRYNHWATEQIESAIAGYNGTATEFRSTPTGPS